MSAPSSSAEDRRERIRSSALLAAYGDALGFVTELTDRSGLKRRAGVDRIATTVPWKRRIGGKFGPTVELPAGTVSDDTQLRLATSRSLLPSGAFDVETFSEIEMTVWPSYALGAGRGSIAAAASLRKRDVSWATNFFDTKDSQYLNGGGNGAAMRIQPHVWAHAMRGDWAWLGDVLVNSVVTHGHARGFIGAVFHAACLDVAMREQRVPGPDDWRRFLKRMPAVFHAAHEDERLSEIWLRQWERRADRRLADAVEETAREIREDLDLCQDLRPGRRGAYAEAVESLKAFDARHRGSGTKTAVLAAIASWLYVDDPLEGLRATADFIGTDTDSIATMAGAILGAVRPLDLPGKVQDPDYVVLEADRAWAAAEGIRPARFPYPDVLRWRSPKSGTDAVLAEKDVVFLAGLGPGGVKSEPYETAGKSPGIWQWTQLWFGQTVLAKRRDHPPRLVESQRVSPQRGYVQPDLWRRSNEPSSPVMLQSAPARVPKASASPERTTVQTTPARQRAEPEFAAQKQARRRTINQITQDVISAGLTDQAIGAGLREVAGHPSAVEASIAYNAIIVKALISRRGGPGANG
jgi:ADP-ribosylglycohydrolase